MVSKNCKSPEKLVLEGIFLSCNAKLYIKVNKKGCYFPKKEDKMSQASRKLKIGIYQPRMIDKR